MVLDKKFEKLFLEVSCRAALSAFFLVGKKDKIAADKSAVDSMRNELNKIDRFIRKNTIAKYGPVREVRKSLVIELAFDSAQISSRHKSGIALRFPRVSRIRWDKPVNDVQSIEEIKKELSIYHS